MQASVFTVLSCRVASRGTAALKSNLQDFCRMPLIRQAPTLGTRLYRLVKELLEELLLLWMKFKAWLTPGTADDEVRNRESLLVACLCW
jgi:hypothetical protein